MHHCVLYTAKTFKPFDRPTLANILGVARVRNEATGITGMLLCGKSTVMQCLEGAQADVEKTLTRIKHDARIYDVRVEVVRSAPARLFPDWSMAYDHGEMAQALADTADLRSPEALPASDGRFNIVLTMLRNFRDGVALHEPHRSAWEQAPRAHAAP